MVGHLAVSMAAPVETPAYLAQHGEPVHAVLIVAIDRLAPVTARGDVVEPAGEPDAEGSAHRAAHSSRMLDCKTLFGLRNTVALRERQEKGARPIRNVPKDGVTHGFIEVLPFLKALTAPG
jgi:hypothetical protein